MKPKFTVLTFLLAIAAALFALPAFSQTNAPTPTPPGNTGTFFTSVEDYFTSFNTNNEGAFSQSHGKLFTGVASIQGGAVPLANVVGLSYDVYKPSNSAISLSIESETLNSGVAGTVISEEIGGGVNFVIHDVELTAFVHGGYFLNGEKKDSPYFAATGLRLLKALTPHTYAGTELSLILPQNQQRIYALMGFTF